ncbi:uncharacterized protein LOC110678640 isoform X2 [Aedes aegypti]|uniref:Uncharacterized protein n=1 Tax=Aedes aegypti TaxID=7159 RepID=A0A6I8U9I6_AEDAE|nr:uncharacterized protein LOC110678640 isoform X2 [Aedes aegypti]
MDETSITTPGVAEMFCKPSEVPIHQRNVQVKTTVNMEATRNPDFDLGQNNISDDNSSETDVILNEYCRKKSSETLQQWAIKHNITHQAVKELLSILKNQYNDNDLPMDPRTLLHTPTSTPVIDIPGGQYWHQGLENCLRNAFKDLDRNITIHLNVNVDGLPIHKSSKHQLWPILCNIHQMPNIKPMAVGIFIGKSKPLSVSDYLKPFVEELIPLMSHGILVNGKSIEIKIRCFICDSPARAFLKGVINFNGKDGCLKCTTSGEYSQISRTVVFPNIRCKLRTDEKFRQKEYGKHHREYSPILEIPGVDMVQDFIIADSLHLLELGVMKRCLIGWRDGSLGYAGKLSANQIEKLSKDIQNVKLPSEIHRSMRGLDCLAHWKGVEWRNLLNYVGVVVFRDVLPQNVYNHFLLLFIAVTICSCDIYSKHQQTAQLMFEKYI